MRPRRDPATSRGTVLGRLDQAAQTAPGRAEDRHRRIAAASVVGVASRVLTAIALVIAVPLAADQLSPAELGIWSLLVTAVALLGFADLGLGNGLMNVLSAAVGGEDRATARRAVTGASVGLVAVAVIGGAVAAVAVAVVPWDRLLGVEPGEVPQLDTAIGVFVGIVALSIPAGLGQRIHMAYQQGWAASVATGLGSVLALAGVGAAAVTGASLPVFVAAMLGGPALAYLGETIWVVGRSHRDLAPRRADFDPVVLRRVLRAGGLFFLLALAAAVGYQTDALVISHYLGPSDVTTYAVAFKLFSLAPTALAAFLLPLWPAYAEALARDDRSWVRRTLARSLVIAAAVSAAASLVLLLAARWLLEVWTPDTPTPSTGLIVALAAWAVIMAVSMAVAMYLNGAHLIRFQVIVALLMAAANLVLSIVFVQRLGIAGPVWASILAQTLILLVPSAVVLRRFLRESDAPPTSPSPTMEALA